MGWSLVKERADLVTVIEAIYAPEPDARVWASGVARAARDVLAPGTAFTLGVTAHEDDRANPALVLAAASDPAVMAENEAMWRHGVASFDFEVYRIFFYPGTPVTTHRALEPRLSAEQREVLRALRARLGAQDVLGLFAYPEPGIAAVLCGMLDHAHAPTRGERAVLTQVAAHLDSGLRLRLRGEAAVAAVVSPAGKVLDLAPALSSDRERLASHVAAVERNRLRARHAADDWRALLEGSYSVVPREDADGKRYYLLVVNHPAAQRHARFTEREAHVVRLAARGLSGKEMAYGLGLSPATVSETLGRAAAKVGLRSRLELAEVAAAMFGAHSGTHGDLGGLTPAESAVLDLLRRGLSNAEIARLRERSLRTVANQVSSILRKAGSPSRRALATSR